MEHLILWKESLQRNNRKTGTISFLRSVPSEALLFSLMRGMPRRSLTAASSSFRTSRQEVKQNALKKNCFIGFCRTSETGYSFRRIDCLLSRAAALICRALHPSVDLQKLPGVISERSSRIHSIVFFFTPLKYSWMRNLISSVMHSSPCSFLIVSIACESWIKYRYDYAAGHEGKNGSGEDKMMVSGARITSRKDLHGWTATVNRNVFTVSWEPVKNPARLHCSI